MENKESLKIISSNDFIWLIKTILKKWYIFLFAIIISLFLGFLNNHKKENLYNTKIEILLKTNDVYDYQNLQSSLGFYNYYGDISNQKKDNWII